MIIYDPENNEHEKPSVDARECVETLGWSYEPKPAPPVVNIKSSDPIDIVLSDGEHEHVVNIKRKRAKAE